MGVWDECPWRLCPPSERQALKGEAVHVAPRVADAGGSSAENILMARARRGEERSDKIVVLLRWSRWSVVHGHLPCQRHIPDPTLLSPCLERPCTISSRHVFS